TKRSRSPAVNPIMGDAGFVWNLSNAQERMERKGTLCNADPRFPMTNRSISWWVLSVLGAVLGGCLGYYIHVWLVETHGLLALMLPGGMIGLGAGLFVRRRSYLFAALCALGAFFLGLYAEWHFWPFIKDERFAYLVAY